jgi:hypothetical protein
MPGGESGHCPVWSVYAGISFWQLQKDTEGDWQYIQTGHQKYEYQNADDGKWGKVEGSGLDGGYPNPFDRDKPSTGLPLGCLITKGDGSFTTYLAFKPAAGGIYVPIRQISWSWNGNAAFTNNAWTLTSGSTNVPASDSPAPSTISWTDCVQRTIKTYVSEP